MVDNPERFEVRMLLDALRKILVVRQQVRVWLPPDQRRAVASKLDEDTHDIIIANSAALTHDKELE